MNKLLKTKYEETKSNVLDKPYSYAFGCFVFVVFIPLLTWIIYFIGDCGFVLISTSLKVGEALSFYGSILTFIGTVALGGLALWQNNKANSINERLNLLEEERFKLELQPFVIVTDWKMNSECILEVLLSPKKLSFEIGKNESEESNCLCLTLHLTNTSNTYATVIYSKAEVYHNDSMIEEWGNGSTNQSNTQLHLKSGATGEIVFYCSEGKMKSFRGKKIKMEFILKNRFCEVYCESFDVVVAALAEHGDNGWYLYISPQNYHIKKFAKK